MSKPPTFHSYFASFDLKPDFRRAQRLAYEQQRARAEADHRKYLEMSGKIGGGPQANTKPTYKLNMGSRKNVKKSDSGIGAIMDILNQIFVENGFLVKLSMNMDNPFQFFAN